MAAVALDFFHMLAGLKFGGDRLGRVAPFVGLGQGFQGRHFKVEAGGGMHDHLFTFADHIVEGVSARGKQVAVFSRIGGAEFGVSGQRLLGEAAALLRVQFIAEFIPPAEGQLPGVLLGGSVAVRTFDLDIGQQGPGDVTIAVHGGGGVTILAQQAAFGIAFAGFQAVVDIVLDELIILGVQFWLLFAFFIEGATVGEFHQALVGDPDAFAPVAGHTGLVGDARVGLAIGHDLDLARRLNRVDHGVAFFIALDRLVPALVKTGIVIGDVARTTAHAPEVAAPIAAFYPHMAALAISAQVGVNGGPGFFGQHVHIGFGHLSEFGWEVLRKLFHERQRIGLVGIGTKHGCGAVRVGYIIVAILLGISGAGRSPTPERPLDFAGLGLHDRPELGIGPFLVALAANLFVDPY